MNGLSRRSAALFARTCPHALLFTAARVGKFTLARMFAQAANCETPHGRFLRRVRHLSAISQLADPQTLLEQGLAERGESADAPTVERMPLILQSHLTCGRSCPIRSSEEPGRAPDVRVGQLRAVQRAAYFQRWADAALHLDGAETMRWMSPTSS